MGGYSEYKYTLLILFMLLSFTVRSYQNLELALLSEWTESLKGGEMQVLIRIRPILMPSTGLWGGGQHLVLIFYNEGQTHIISNHQKKIRSHPAFVFGKARKKEFSRYFRLQCNAMLPYAGWSMARFQSPYPFMQAVLQLLIIDKNSASIWPLLWSCLKTAQPWSKVFSIGIDTQHNIRLFKSTTRKPLIHVCQQNFFLSQMTHILLTKSDT